MTLSNDITGYKLLLHILNTKLTFTCSKSTKKNTSKRHEICSKLTIKTHC